MKLFSRLRKANKPDLQIDFSLSGYFCYIESIYGKNAQAAQRQPIILAESVITLFGILPQICGDDIAGQVASLVSKFIDDESTDFHELMQDVERTIFDCLNASEREELASYSKEVGVFPVFIDQEKPTDALKVTYSLINDGSTSWSPSVNFAGLSQRYIFPRIPILLFQYVESIIDEHASEVMRSRIAIEAFKS